MRTEKEENLFTFFDTFVKKIKNYRSPKVSAVWCKILLI